jgi:aldose sugar dehydrogenase
MRGPRSRGRLAAAGRDHPSTALTTRRTFSTTNRRQLSIPAGEPEASLSHSTGSHPYWPCRQGQSLRGMNPTGRPKRIGAPGHGGRSCRWWSPSLVVLLAACAETPTQERVETRTGEPPSLASCDPTGWSEPEIDVLARGLEVPWSVAVVDDDRILVTERPGRIRLIDAAGLQSEPWSTLPVEATGESGLLGIMPAPDYAESGAVYVAGVYEVGRGMGIMARVWRRAARAMGRAPQPGLTLRVHRIIMAADGRASAPEVVVDGLPASILHPGGAMLFTEADRFLLSVGDSMEPWTAQDAGDPRGSIVEVALRAGRAARFRAGVEIVAMGVRNSQGVGLLPADRGIVFIDHGPTGLDVEQRRTGKDELNLLSRGSNYGWPLEAGLADHPRFEAPMAEWTPAIAPAGLTVRPHPSANPRRADIFVTGLRGQTLRRVEMHDSAGPGWTVACQETVLGASHGRLRAVTLHPEGGLLVTTSNRDGRGTPRDGDDQLLLVRPRPSHATRQPSSL